MKFLVSFMLVLLFMNNTFAETKRAFTFEDFFALKRLSNLKTSVTGNYLSVEVTTPDIEENTLNKSVLIIKSNGDIIQEFGTKEGKVKKPYISNDEKYVYFIQENQIWRMMLAGSMPEKITDIQSGVKNFKFSPKENYILIESDVIPAGIAMDYINSGKKSESKIQARIYDHLMYRHWNEWRDETRKHLLLFNVKDKTFKDLTPGNFDAPPIALGSSHDNAFSPDETEISFVSNHALRSTVNYFYSRVFFVF